MYRSEKIEAFPYSLSVALNCVFPNITLLDSIGISNITFSRMLLHPPTLENTAVLEK